jgi:hypothetical protein
LPALSTCPALLINISVMSRKITDAATYYREPESEVF